MDHVWATEDLDLETHDGYDRCIQRVNATLEGALADHADDFDYEAHGTPYPPQWNHAWVVEHDDAYGEVWTWSDRTQGNHIRQIYRMPVGP